MGHIQIGANGPKIPTKATCPECDRVFDLLNEADAEEFYYGHDCE